MRILDVIRCRFAANREAMTSLRRLDVTIESWLTSLASNDVRARRGKAISDVKLWRQQASTCARSFLISINISRLALLLSSPSTWRPRPEWFDFLSLTLFTHETLYEYVYWDIMQSGRPDREHTNSKRHARTTSYKMNIHICPAVRLSACQINRVVIAHLYT